MGVLALAVPAALAGPVTASASHTSTSTPTESSRSGCQTRPRTRAARRGRTVKRANTVVLGLGVATLTAVNGAIPLTVDDVAGVEIAGIMIDAGAQNSPVLLRLGKSNGNNHNSSAANPTVLHDVFFRIGGPHVGRASLSLEVNSDDVILDNIWVWRADHGEGVGWTVNTADTGVVINGDDVVATRRGARLGRLQGG